MGDSYQAYLNGVVLGGLSSVRRLVRFGDGDEAIHETRGEGETMLPSIGIERKGRTPHVLYSPSGRRKGSHGHPRQETR